jgi:2-polyprenyl-3-methyl-5-hydroxy-6-metoxy-1,4-benzoquinol methylase
LLEIRNSDEITVFEYGCGWGDFLTKIRGDGVHVIGLELDQRKINFCKSQDIQIVNDLSEIPGPIDIFFCNQVLEHLSDPKGTLLEIKQYLHPKFVGYASVPLYELTELRKMKIATASDKNLNPYEHLNLFSSQTFEAILGSVGFGSFRRIHNGVIFRNCIKL